MSNQLDYEINKELGECYLFMGDFDKAEEYYRKAAENNTESAAPYMGLATVAVQRSDLDKALVLYKKAASVEETISSALPITTENIDFTIAVRLFEIRDLFFTKPCIDRIRKCH